MSLKISLKPHEKIILGGAVIRNGAHQSTFMVETKTLILRDRDIMREELADTPCKRIYFAIQLLYMDETNRAQYHAMFWRLAGELTGTVKTMTPYVTEISALMLSENYYKALKIAKKMIAYEKELLDHATSVKCI